MSSSIISKKMLIIILFAVFSQIGYSLLAPLYPFLAEERGVSSSLVGIIFSSFAISNFLLTILTPYLSEKSGRKNLLILAILTESSCTIWFGLLTFIENQKTFIILSFIIRFCQGAGGAVVQTLIYSLTAAISDDKEIEKNLGYIEVGTSIGISIGPLIASLGYYMFGFNFPFLISGFMEMLLISLVPILDIHKYENDDDDNEENKVDILPLLTNRNIILTFLAVTMDSISISFIYPVFASHLNKKFNLEPEQTALFFIITTIFYFFSLQILSHANKFFGNRITMTIGMFFNSFFILFLGPSQFLPQRLSIIIIGLSGLGFGGAFISIPAVIDAIEILKNEVGLNENSAQDYASATYNLGYFLGETVGPLFGGNLTQEFGFVHACNINCAANYFYAIVYACFIVFDKVFKKKESEEKIKKIDEGELEKLI
jgi:MFS family permease